MFTKVDFMLFKTNDAITNVRITHPIVMHFIMLEETLILELLYKKKRTKSAVVPIAKIYPLTSFEVNKKLAETIHNN